MYVHKYSHTWSRYSAEITFGTMRKKNKIKRTFNSMLHVTLQPGVKTVPFCFAETFSDEKWTRLGWNRFSPCMFPEPLLNGKCSCLNQAHDFIRKNYWQMNGWVSFTSLSPINRKSSSPKLASQFKEVAGLTICSSLAQATLFPWMN